MRHFTGLAIAAALVAFTAQDAQAGDHLGKVPWQTPEQGFQKARMTGKPVMLAFSADW